MNAKPDRITVAQMLQLPLTNITEHQAHVLDLLRQGYRLFETDLGEVWVTLDWQPMNRQMPTGEPSDAVTPLEMRAIMNIFRKVLHEHDAVISDLWLVPAFSFETASYTGMAGEPCECAVYRIAGVLATRAEWFAKAPYVLRCEALKFEHELVEANHASALNWVI